MKWDPNQYYGHGLAVGAGGQPRYGAVFASTDADLQYFRLPMGGGGDSGAPVRFNEELEAAAAHRIHHNVGIFQGEEFFLGAGNKISLSLELIGPDSDSNNWIDVNDRGKWELVDSSNC